MLQHSLKFIGCRSSSDAALLEFSFGLYQYSTTPFGPSVKFAFALFHYTIGGVGACEYSLCYGPPLRSRDRFGVFRRREGVLLAAHFCASPSGPSSSLWSFLRGVTSFRSSPPAFPFIRGIAFPSSGRTCSLLCSPIRVCYLFRGRRTCFPVFGFLRLRFFLLLLGFFWRSVLRSRSLPGRPEVFPGRDLVRLRHLCCQGPPASELRR